MDKQVFLVFGSNDEFFAVYETEELAIGGIKTTYCRMEAEFEIIRKTECKTKCIVYCDGTRKDLYTIVRTSVYSTPEHL